MFMCCDKLLMCTCALFVDVLILVDTHFVNVFYVARCILVVDVAICIYLLSKLFEIKAQVDVHVMCTCAHFARVCLCIYFMLLSY
jgi:hypothetical protein